MNRIEFTQNIVALLHQMILLGETPIMDFCKRSDAEQARLYRIGRDREGKKVGDTVTNCDGVSTISAHQRGRALDILFLDGDKIVDPKAGWDHWHQIWEQWGGAKMLEWDRSHFEG